MFPAQKTKIICTIGPASQDEETIKALIRAGMNIARLNFSHGRLEDHAQVIDRLRRVSQSLGRRVAIMADLPGPKMRLGTLAKEPLLLERGQRVVLTVRKDAREEGFLPVDFPELPRLVRPGETIFLNDGLLELRVERIEGPDIYCQVVVGGEIRSRKGINIPSLRVGLSALTDFDRRALAFALEQGVEAISLSFVSRAEDLREARRLAKSLGHQVFLIAKIERAAALEEIEEIILEADGLMIARGDLGVEIPIEQIALVQKDLIKRANLHGKPVIVATQMLQSMTHHRRPTRAEATDVANAVLDGADALMLSDETATGKYPVEATEMLARIARTTEPHLDHFRFRRLVNRKTPLESEDVIALSVDDLVDRLEVGAVICLESEGQAARALTRVRLPCWIIALSPEEKICQGLLFSYGVLPMRLEAPFDPKAFLKEMTPFLPPQDLVLVEVGSVPSRFRLELLPSDKEFH